MKWPYMQHLFEGEIPKTARILHLGCGNSTISGDMYTAGWEDVFNVDISATVIANMATKHADMPRMRWEAMDVTALTVPPASFDIALDK
jgi:2-polyprenyl-3-methyl-5-hydroxy-6-metoxy-1,4-benzoquinol methylase